ncbi:UNVERIFIED_CONTAM: hypothetical protein FKN15_023759 [Acipenser sinensis]
MVAEDDSEAYQAMTNEEANHYDLVKQAILQSLNITGETHPVACGQDHSLFLTDNGNVYSCGWGADGQTESGQVFVWGYGILGKGPNLSESRTPEMIPPTLLGCLEFNPDIAVAQIRCGLNHFAAITGDSAGGGGGCGLWSGSHGSSGQIPGLSAQYMLVTDPAPACTEKGDELQLPPTLALLMIAALTDSQEFNPRTTCFIIHTY